MCEAGAAPAGGRWKVSMNRPRTQVQTISVAIRSTTSNELASLLLSAGGVVILRAASDSCRSRLL